MSTQKYKTVRFRDSSLALIDTINEIISDYVAQGYRLTVRQLYYQLVSRNVIENTERSYKNITNLVNDGKLAGLIDWSAIEDRTREFIRVTRWSSAAEILSAAASNFHMDMWENQPNRVFVIVEKEALAGVFEGVCREYDVPLLAARGYPSGTVLREFALSDLIPTLKRKQRIAILHLGDHDPSGLDMSRDMRERFHMFIVGRDGGALGDNFLRIALNYEQVRELNLPPNPAKTTDARFAEYRRQYGSESWELDALTPEYLVQLVRTNVERFRDSDLWDQRREEIERIRSKISVIAEEFSDVV